MKKHLHKFETTLWLFIKFIFYISLMMAFVRIMGRESIGLTRLSRTLGITVSTFAIVGLLFLSVYGKYDVGRRKSKPIIYSLTLAVICTDIVTYLQLMIMRTNVPSVWQFRLNSLGLLGLALCVQLVLIIFFICGKLVVFPDPQAGTVLRDHIFTAQAGRACIFYAKIQKAISDFVCCGLSQSG